MGSGPASQGEHHNAEHVCVRQLHARVQLRLVCCGCLRPSTNRISMLNPASCLPAQFLMHLMSVSLFRMIGALSRTQVWDGNAHIYPKPDCVCKSIRQLKQGSSKGGCMQVLLFSVEHGSKAYSQLVVWRHQHNVNPLELRVRESMSSFMDLTFGFLFILRRW